MEAVAREVNSNCSMGSIINKFNWAECEVKYDPKQVVM